MQEMSFKDIKLVMCGRCSSFMLHHKWISGKTLAEAVEANAKAAIRNAPEGIQITPVYDNGQIPPIKPGVNRNFQVKIIVDEEEYLLPAKLEVTTCPKCSKINTQYFEGTVQLRNVSKEAMRFARDDIKAQKEKGIHLTKESREEDGVDLLLTDQKYVQALARRLHQKFGGDLKVTSKLFSKDTATWKDLYRVTAYLKFPSIKVGEIIQKGNRTLKVEHVGTKVHLIDTKTGKKITMAYERLK